MDSFTLVESILNFSSYFTILGDSNLSAFLGKLTAIGKVALGLGFVIFIHELGHFLAAKTFGVRCDKFYVGFDVPIRLGPIHLPRTLGKFKWGETEYGIGIIPLGGYVKMLGQDDDPRAAKEEAERARAGGTPVQPLDPRSYPAKPVWQRMIIISAGVVMNLISAVFLAGAAYFLGVPYMPSIVGSPTAGGPAWVADLQSGDQVMRIGNQSSDDPNMRYEDMVTNIILNGLNAEAQPLEVQLDRSGERVIANPVPSPKYNTKGFPLLGFVVERSTTLGGFTSRGKKIVIDQFSKLDAEQLGLAYGDRIVSIDGEKLPERSGEIYSEELRKRMAAKWNQSVTLGIERPGDEEKKIEAKNFEVTLPPVAKQTLGLGFEIAPVTSIRPGSAGQKAGFQAGDLITAIDGTPVVDGLKLPAEFASRSGKEVKFTVKRGSETTELTVASPSPPVFDGVSATGAADLSLGGIGVAFGISSTVSFVPPELGDKSVKVGDQLAQSRWAPTPQQLESVDAILDPKVIEALSKSQAVDKLNNTIALMELIQGLPIDSKMALDLKRDGQTISTELSITESTEFAADERGLMLMGISRIHKTDSFVEAFKLGLWETKKRFFDVLVFFKMAPKIGFKGLAGPIRLFDIATQEAKTGTARLLLFLTLLSANLAILNFLPIPALDGGHMMFLIAEAVLGRPVNEDLQIRLTMAGVLGLLALMAFVILKDISSYF